MNTGTYLAVAALVVLGVATSNQAVAGCAMELEVVGTSSKTIRIYKAGGQRDGEVDKALALKQPVLECDETLGLIKVELTDKRMVWINRSDAKRIAGVAQNSDVCVTDPASKDSDHVLAATSGAEPTAAHCKPAGK